MPAPHVRRVALAALAVTLSAALGGCAAARPANDLAGVRLNQTLSQPDGRPMHGGTVSYAEAPGSSPNYIFPIEDIADFSVANAEQFCQLLYRPLYWFGTDAKPTVDFRRSVGMPPTFSDGDRTVTITLNHYRWSDGETVDARDITFFMNLVTANKDDYGGYTPGDFPDNVSSVGMPDGPTGRVVVFRLTTRVNPTWFLYNELSQITPLPIAWDRTALDAPAPKADAGHLPDTTRRGAIAVYQFLSAQSHILTTFATSPLWRIVDGPWRLQSFTTNGQATFVPNRSYVGPYHPYLSRFIELPFTSDTAEYDTLISGASHLQVGFVPNEDVPQLASVGRQGYRTVAVYAFGIANMALNFNSRNAGALFRQTYIRQALQHLIDQSGWSRAYFDNLSTPLYGPVPDPPPNRFADRYERSNPLPFSPSTAARLLRTHGWSVQRGGTTTCEHPARCGDGIPKGKTLAFNMDVGSGSIATDSAMDDFVADAALVGIRIHIFLQPFNTVLGEAVPTSRTWDVANYGEGDSWTFGPDYYASGEALFARGAANNVGDYYTRKAQRLVDATTSAPARDSQRALDAYQNYIARQVPVLWEPEQATEMAIAKNLGGAVLEQNTFGNLDPESWYYIRPGTGGDAQR